MSICLQRFACRIPTFNPLLMNGRGLMYSSAAIISPTNAKVTKLKVQCKTSILKKFPPSNINSSSSIAKKKEILTSKYIFTFKDSNSFKIQPNSRSLIGSRFLKRNSILSTGCSAYSTQVSKMIFFYEKVVVGSVSISR